MSHRHNKPRAGLLATLRAWARAFPGPQSAPTRVGLLDSGELVLMDALGRTQVISAATAALIHRVIDAALRRATPPP